MEIMFAQLSLVTAWNFAEDSRKHCRCLVLQNCFGSCCREFVDNLGDAVKTFTSHEKLLNEIKTALKPARFFKAVVSLKKIMPS
jgi:hypothetical protein